MRVDEELLFFSCRRFAFPSSKVMSTNTQKMVVALCIDKKIVLKREGVSANVKIPFAYHIHLYVQSTFCIACLYVPFFHSLSVVSCLLHIFSSWFLTPYLGVLFKENVFTISPVPGLLESLIVEISECS